MRSRWTSAAAPSGRSRERWKYTLEHLITGTDEVPGFGEMFVDQIRVMHVEAWKTGVAKLIAARRYSPTTANGWLAILRVILKAAKRELGLPMDPTEGVAYFDTSEHPRTPRRSRTRFRPRESASSSLACARSSRSTTR